MHDINISRLIAAAFTSISALFLSCSAAFAADASERPGKKAIAVILVIVFAAALISSTVITYKLRVKNISRQTKDTDEVSKISTDGKEL